MNLIGLSHYLETNDKYCNQKSSLSNLKNCIEMKLIMNVIINNYMRRVICNEVTRFSFLKYLFTKKEFIFHVKIKKCNHENLEEDIYI